MKPPFKVFWPFAVSLLVSLILTTGCVPDPPEYGLGDLSAPDEISDSVRIISTNGDSIQYIVTASHMERYYARKEMLAREIDIRTYLSDGSERSRLVSDSARVDEASSVITAWGHPKMRSVNGDSLLARRLVWDRGRDIMRATGSVYAVYRLDRLWAERLRWYRADDIITAAGDARIIHTEPSGSDDRNRSTILDSLDADSLYWDREDRYMQAVGSVRAVYRGDRLMAEFVSWDQNRDFIIARGDVEIHKLDRNAVVYTDFVQIDRRDDKLEASGKVVLVQNGNTTRGYRLKSDLGFNRIEMINASAEGQIKGEEIDRAFGEDGE